MKFPWLRAALWCLLLLCATVRCTGELLSVRGAEYDQPKAVASSSQAAVWSRSRGVAALQLAALQQSPPRDCNHSHRQGHDHVHDDQPHGFGCSYGSDRVASSFAVLCRHLVCVLYTHRSCCDSRQQLLAEHSSSQQNVSERQGHGVAPRGVLASFVHLWVSVEPDRSSEGLSMTTDFLETNGNRERYGEAAGAAGVAAAAAGATATMQTSQGSNSRGGSSSGSSSIGSSSGSSSSTSSNHSSSSSSNSSIMLLALGESRSSGGGRGSSTHVARKLLQQGSAMCPQGCSPGACVSVGTAGMGFRCTNCMNKLVVSKVSGLCMCPAGRYLGAQQSCIDCPRGSYCLGGPFDPNTLQPAALGCPAHMTTLGLRSTTIRSCVNLPGYYYAFTADGNMTSVLCPADTFGFGFRKQRACVPCPTGFTTNGLEGQISPQACGVPPGYFLKAPGVAASCPQGTYKSSTVPAVRCTCCPVGSLTQKEACTSADACTVLEPGNYASVLQGGAVREVRMCPQNYWCPGGMPQAAFDPNNPAALDPNEPTIKACADGAWTQAPGSTSAVQCMTPPGFKTSGGVTIPCEAGSFRDEWLPPAQAQGCTPCGEGVLLDLGDRLSVYNISTGSVTQLPVGTSSEDCYIQPGQGLYFESTTATYRARNCDRGDEYGVPNRTYGLSPVSCRSCPLNQITSSNATMYPNSAAFYVSNGDGTGGFTSVRACVNLDGYGMGVRVSSSCAAGFYNARDTWGPCQSCPQGTTTQGVGTGITQADCGLTAGYGFHDGAIRPCPRGTYAAWTSDTTKPCTPCPGGTTSSQTGVASPAGCDLCAPGHGGLGCAALCGGAGAGATYQPAGSPVDSSCRPCTVQDTGYSFVWQDTNDVFNVSAVSRQGANASTDCLANFAQVADGAWYMSVSSPAGVSSSPASSFADCLQRCTSPNCMFVTYDYSSGGCTLRMLVPAQYVGAPILALKAVPSGDLGTIAWSVRIRSRVAQNQPQQQQQQQQQQQHQSTVKAQSIASGQYSFYQDAAAFSVGSSSKAAPGATGFTSLQDCMAACDDDSDCAGFSIALMSKRAETPTTCTLIFGDSTPNTGKRTMIRADINRLQQLPT